MWSGKLFLVSSILVFAGISAGDDDLPPVDDDPLSNYFLFDLGPDPYELTNQFYNESYADTVEKLQTRWQDWIGLVKDPEIADTTSKLSTWKANGGVCSWIDTDFEELDVEVLYEAEDPPHIVFVLVDDWGWNDIGYHSTYLSWTTPNIDKLASEGVKLSNYHTHETCSPSRGALLTGRYPIRLGMWEQREEAELPLEEVTLAQEMKSCGYNTYMVGKWHLGMSTIMHYPTRRGFDYFYGYFNGDIDYWNKTYGKHLDLQDQEEIVTDSVELSSGLHNGYLLQSKAEAVIKNHAANHSGTPMFLYYSMQLIHGEWAVPSSYSDRCSTPNNITDDYTTSVEHIYCGMNLMLDEAIANLTCTLEEVGLASNTIMVVASDNGGEQTMSGNSVPFCGNKGSYMRGGVSANAFIHSPLLPEDIKGTTFDGLMHVTDWLPTLMHLASGGEWTESMVGADLDGANIWPAIITQDSSPRREIVFYADPNSTVIQYDDYKLVQGVVPQGQGTVDFYFDEDLDPSLASQICSSPSLEYSTSSLMTSSSKGLLGSTADTVQTTDLWNLSLTAGLLTVSCFAVVAFLTRAGKSSSVDDNLSRKSDSGDISETTPLKCSGSASGGSGVISHA